MANRKIFVNLSVTDLSKSKEFYSKLGFEFNPQFTDENAACMVISEDIFTMLLSENHFKNFTNKEIVDSTKSTEAIIALSAESKEEVDSIVNKALEAGGSPSVEPKDYGFMYQWGFQDPDGHLWEVLYMDESAVNW